MSPRAESIFKKGNDAKNGWWFIANNYVTFV